MKLNWFSPLPPAGTEIAQYSARILPFLREHCDVTLWTDQDDWDKAAVEGVEVERFRLKGMPWAKLNQADINVYHIGNHPGWHGGIWEVSRRQPGLVVLHDLSLQHFFTGYLTQDGDWTVYQNHMRASYGSLGQTMAMAFCSGCVSVETMAERFPLTQLGAENALGVLLHNPEMQFRREQSFPCPVAFAPLPCFSQMRGGEHTHKKWNDQERPYRLIVFGRGGPNRRLATILESLAAFPARDRFRLGVYGNIHDEVEIKRLVRRLGIRRHVTLHGFVSQETLGAALDSAHLALNLRYPTMGEASAAQLRIFSHGLPSLVSSVGWYATLPSAAVHFVRPDHEQEDIHAQLAKLLALPDSFARQGKAALGILRQHHQPSDYARRIVKVARQIGRSRSHLLSSYLTRRVSSEMRIWSNEYGDHENYQRVAREILSVSHG